MNTRVKKILRNILFLLSIPVIIGAFVFAHVSTRDEVCKGVRVSISNPELSFVRKDDVMKIVRSMGVYENKTRLRSVDLRMLEDRIEENNWVEKCNSYISAGNVLHIHAAQRVPVVRIQPLEETESPYYLDIHANTIPYSMQYIPNLPVVTTAELGFTSADQTVKSELVTLAQFISHDTFWNHVITQIDRDSNGQLVLIPAIGEQRILLGDIHLLAQKMDKLFLLYRQGYNTVQWNDYDEIDLRFEKQVVCRNTRGKKLAIDPYDKNIAKQVEAKATTIASPIAKNHGSASVKPAAAVPPKATVKKEQSKAAASQVKKEGIAKNSEKPKPRAAGGEKKEKTTTISH